MDLYVERLATAKGRLSRLQFLKYQLLLFAIWMVVTIPIVLLWVNLAGESTGWLLPLVLLVPGSFMIYANVAIMVRRFHDFDFNGW
ncbi:MAG: DUF805 domain-containing protein [Nitrospirae bacterium]|nr:DUF805 domain-containing protein [Nitrospirota bacterium]